jgi:DNA-binding YbaB/EbfC family protein
MFNKKMLGDMMRQAQVLQEKMAKAQEEAGKRSVEATSGGGMVTVIANGRQELLSIKVDRQVVNPEDIEMLQDLVLAAVNEALKKSRDMMAEEMKGLTGGLNIPGMF